MEIGQGTVRHLVTIEHVLGALARFDRRRVVPRLRAILVSATYQMIWMDRVPPFAAVDQAVELARRLVRGRSPAMVNAVLRRVADTIVARRAVWRRLHAAQVRVSWAQACQFGRAVLPTAEGDARTIAHLAAATGERRGRFNRLVERLGRERAEAVAWASQAVPVNVLQQNTLRASAEEFAALVHAAFGDACELRDDAAYLPASASFVETPLFVQGLAYVQDTTAHAAALAVQARPGERVLDLCAAPGGKSVTLAIAMRDEGEVVACDTRAERLARVAENAQRFGLPCIRTRLLSGTEADLLPDRKRFDAALVDVPCSNTGVLARRPEARLGLTPAKLNSLTTAQHELLRRAAATVRPGGRLVYSTCSIEPEENEQVVSAFLGQHVDWRLDGETTFFPAWGLRASDWRDGGYLARLVRECSAP
jgi:16S rRNA (cytosine967-C5)-methyltransferase